MALAVLLSEVLLREVLPGRVLLCELLEERLVVIDG